MSAMLDETRLPKDNYKVDGDKMERARARDFLKAKGVVR